MFSGESEQVGAVVQDRVHSWWSVMVPRKNWDFQVKPDTSTCLRVLFASVNTTTPE